MSPVEAATVSTASMPNVVASASAMAAWSSSPAGPVAALAQPLVTISGAHPPAGLLEMSPAHPDRRRLDQVGREDRRRGRRFRAGHDDDPEVRPAAGLDARAQAAGPEAGRQLGPLLDPRRAHAAPA